VGRLKNFLIEMEEEMQFSGSSYDPDLDRDRLTTQFNRCFDVMCDGNWHTLKELVSYSGGTEQAISARVRDMRKSRFGGHTVERRRVAGKRGVYEYKLTLNHPLLEAA
jgi:hypothetical protein